MLKPLTIEQTEDFLDTLLDLRMEVHNYNLTVTCLDQQINDPLTKVYPHEIINLVICNEGYRKRRKVVADHIEQLITVVRYPVSLESRIFGFLNRILSYQVVNPY